MQKPFTWGVAAASYQVEGRLPNDARGDCVWDMFSHEPGFTRLRQNGRSACMHVERYKEDCKLMGELGIDAYRLSISWPRVFPNGTGQINEQGLAFYDKLVDELLQNNVAPWITLFHWDYPYQLFLQGGWLNPDSPKWFADYAQVIADKLSDRVNHWFTLNEPQCFIHLGHAVAEHAPGLKLGFKEVLTAAHNCLLAHGHGVQILRNAAKGECKIGAAPVGKITIPADTSPQSIEAARNHMFAIDELNTWSNTWFGDPMLLGHYPEDGLAKFEEFLPQMGTDDLKTICQPIDFYGANIYTAEKIKANSNGQTEMINPLDGDKYTSMDWHAIEDCLYWGSRFFYDRYKLPVIITENGMANNDWVNVDGEVLDPQRIDYLKRHLGELHKAQLDGVPIEGYFQWSIMDNFEWAWGHDRRFGLIHVDYQTQVRTPKSSYYWYRDMIKDDKANG